MVSRAYNEEGREVEQYVLAKYYEITCDFCGSAEPLPGNRADVEARAKANGWLFIKDKHYCMQRCRLREGLDEVS